MLCEDIEDISLKEIVEIEAMILEQEQGKAEQENLKLNTLLETFPVCRMLCKNFFH